MKQVYYQGLFDQTAEEANTLKKQYDCISRIRSIAALAALLGLISGFYYKNGIGYIAGAVCIAVFVLFVIRHAKVVRKQEYNESCQHVLQKYIDRFGDGWHSFPNQGAEYLSDELPYTKDLDLFGQDSLYQYICTANTVYGCTCLAEFLLSPSPDKQDILNRQEAVKELSEKKEFSLHIQTLSSLIEKKKMRDSHAVIEAFIREAELDREPAPGAMKAVMWALPLATAACLLSAILGFKSELSLAVGIIGSFLQFLITVIGYKRNTAVLSPIASFHSHISVYEKLFAEIEHMEFAAGYLRQLQMELKNGIGAVRGIKRLERIGDAVKIRHNGIAYVICSGLFLWDYHCIARFDAWKCESGSSIRSWLKAVGALEALLSLAVLCNVRETYCFPSVCESAVPMIRFENMKHPLMKEADAVGNSLELMAATCVITGSNMSGKTTFLRGAGLNLVLAYAGAPVSADRFDTAVMTIFTSMRIEDSVSKGISTFYAEILRIRQMVEYSQKKIPMIALIDEIFKGTNSADRIIGATEAIKKLSVSWSVTIVSTHDFELCNLEHDSAVHAVNYHFSESYVQDEIQFDYKIKHGRCKTTNARYLLRMAGIL